MIELIYILIAWLVLGVSTTVLLNTMHTISKLEAVVFTLFWPIALPVTALFLLRIK